MTAPLDELVAEMEARRVHAMRMSAPLIRYRSTNRSPHGECMDWRAEIRLEQSDWPDCPPILGGFVDFLVVRLYGTAIADILQTLPGVASCYTELFDAEYLAGTVAVQFPDSAIDTVLLITGGAIAPPLRGQHLGAWMVNEVVYRMLDTANGLVAMYPHPPNVNDEPISISAVEAVDQRCSYFRGVGLDPLTWHAGFLAQVTYSVALAQARAAMHHIAVTPVRAKTTHPSRFH